jgi:hypothetical protein
MRSRNEQIELDNFKADYFDANTTGKIPSVFRFHLAVNITATKKYTRLVGLQTLFLFLRMQTQAGESDAPPVKSEPDALLRKLSVQFCYQYSHQLRTYFALF